jgi:hypothetical protein
MVYRDSNPRIPSIKVGNGGSGEVLELVGREL